MYGIAGYVATAPKVGGKRAAAQELPGNHTRPNNNKLRAQLARAQRDSDNRDLAARKRRYTSGLQEGY